MDVPTAIPALVFHPKPSVELAEHLVKASDELVVGLDTLRLSREFVLIGWFQIGAGDVPYLADER